MSSLPNPCFLAAGRTANRETFALDGVHRIVPTGLGVEEEATEGNAM